MTVAQMVKVLRDILEEYRAIELADSPITWIRVFDESSGKEGFVLCIKSGDIFDVTVTCAN